MQFDRGYISAYFVTNPDRMEAVLDEPAHPDHRQEDLQRPGPAAGAREGACSRASRSLIIAEDVDGEALATLVVNKLRGTISRARRQGAGLRRPPQGDAARHRDPDRRHRHQRGGRPQARLRRRSRTSARPAASSPPRTTRRSSTATATGGPDQGPHEPDQGADRGHHLGLRPREAPGAPRQAGRRRRRHQGRRGHRGRAQGEEAPHRGCALDDPRGRRGGPRRRRRHRAPAGHPGARQAQARGRRGRSASTSSARPSRPRSARSPTTPAPRGEVVVEQVQGAEDRPRLRRPQRRVRRHVREGHRRRGQGDPLRAPERRLDRRHGPDDGDADHRPAGEGARPAPAAATTTAAEGWTSSPSSAPTSVADGRTHETRSEAGVPSGDARLCCYRDGYQGPEPGDRQASRRGSPRTYVSTVCYPWADGER